MRLALIALLCLGLVGCVEEGPQQIACYDIVDIKGGQPKQPILIDKCTGMTWIALRETFPLREDQTTPSYMYKWLRIERYAAENSVAGISKK